MPEIQIWQFYVGGMDGTGKTTQTTLPKGYFESTRTRARIYHVYGLFLRRLLEFVLELHPSSQLPRTVMQTTKVRVSLALGVIQTLRVLDTILCARPISILRRIRGEIVMSDRSYYDCYLGYRLHGQALPLLEISSRVLMPRHGVILDAPPEVAYERKPEFSVEMFRKQRKLYWQMSRTLGYPVVSSVGSVESVFDNIKEILDNLQ